MEVQNGFNGKYEVAVIGGSYAGLQAALSLGRSMRRVVVIDSGQPCNRFTPHAHNLITHDGDEPGAINLSARNELKEYATVELMSGLVKAATESLGSYRLRLADGRDVLAGRLLLAFGIRDLLPPIDGLAECWGKTVIHCPYCHGYEVKGRATGVIANGDVGYEYGRMVRHWTSDLTIFTNGPQAFNEEQRRGLSRHGVRVVEGRIDALRQEGGQVQEVVVTQAGGDRQSYPVEALYYRSPFELSVDLTAGLGYELTEQGLIRIDDFQRTPVPGIYAAGDCVTPFRSLAAAISGGALAGAMLNKEMIEEAW